MAAQGRAMSHMASRVRAAVLPKVELKESLVDRKSIKLILFLMTFFAYSYFYGGAYHTQNARYDVIHAFVEKGFREYRTFAIDRFIASGQKELINTESWVTFQGHYYSTEAPGASLLGILAYEPLYLLETSQGINPTSLKWTVVNAYVIHLFVTVFFGALGVVYFFRILCKQKVTDGLGVTLSLIFAFATLNLPYGSQLWGHVTALSFLVMSLYYFLEDTSNRSLTMAGLCGGMAILVDYFAIIAVALFLIVGIIKHGGRLIFFVVGLAFPMGVLAFYNNSCFGSPWRWAAKADNLSQISMYLLVPSFEVLWNLLFGGFRGMFIHMPILLLAPVGFISWFKRDARDLLLWISLVAIVTYLVLNTSLVHWHGGRTVAARYQILTMLFWILPLKEIKLSGTMLWVFSTFVSISVFNMVAIAAVSPLCVSGIQSPFYQCILPKLFTAEFHPYVFLPRMFTHTDLKKQAEIQTAWNLGTLMGLKGFLSLLPFFTVMMLFLGVLKKRLGNQDPNRLP